MSQLPEIPTSSYTPEMETLRAIPDIPTFEGEPVPVSRNLLTFGTRPLQLLPLLGTEFLVRYETSRMRGFQTELRDAAPCVAQLSAHRQTTNSTKLLTWRIKSKKFKKKKITYLSLKAAHPAGLIANREFGARQRKKLQWSRPRSQRILADRHRLSLEG
ncbi:hypothetical protein JCGZ_08602 [Jatropha curcas]|uniref:Uncharacterized protein n=1 Tax=Jatropha curcas TaxID=180498 RepID=A0A067KK13_JATCU|nr:hypothetical protein JCGZ_08602 [Jatropha curcas]